MYYQLVQITLALLVDELWPNLFKPKFLLACALKGCVCLKTIEKSAWSVKSWQDWWCSCQKYTCKPILINHLVKQPTKCNGIFPLFWNGERHEIIKVNIPETNVLEYKSFPEKMLQTNRSHHWASRLIVLFLLHYHGLDSHYFDTSRSNIPDCYAVRNILCEQNILNKILEVNYNTIFIV